VTNSALCILAAPVALGVAVGVKTTVAVVSLGALAGGIGVTVGIVGVREK